jgi:hypothetical protein
MAENAFRACKTGQLELRPIDVRKEERTRAHVFVVMLSYLLLHQLRKNWGEPDMTVEEGLGWLETLGTIRIQLPQTNSKNPIIINRVPEPRENIRRLFQPADIPCPEILPANKPTTPVTGKKLNKSVDNKKLRKFDPTQIKERGYSENTRTVKREHPLETRCSISNRF